MKDRWKLVLSVFLVWLWPAVAGAQTTVPKQEYYVGMGDSVAAGQGAIPVTNGYVYRLYEESVFGSLQTTAFGNAAVRGVRSWDLRDNQVPQVLCANTAQRPTVITITVGANDLFLGDPDLVGIAKRVAQGVDLLLHNDGILSPVLGATPVVDPHSKRRCRALSDATVMVSNYYSLPHPVPSIFQLLDVAERVYDQSLRFWLQHIAVPPGSRIVVVDLYTPSLGQQGLVTIQRRLGATAPFDFDFHPTNLGHAFIAEQFKKAWNNLP